VPGCTASPPSSSRPTTAFAPRLLFPIHHAILTSLPSRGLWSTCIRAVPFAACSLTASNIHHARPSCTQLGRGLSSPNENTATRCTPPPCTSSLGTSLPCTVTPSPSSVAGSALTSVLPCHFRARPNRVRSWPASRLPLAPLSTAPSCVAAPPRTCYSTRAPGPLLAPLLVPGCLLPPGSCTCRARARPHAAACSRSRAARQRSAACTWPSRTLACAHAPDPHRLLPAHSRAACAPSRAVPVRATRCPRASVWPGAAVLARRPSTSTPSRLLPPTRTDAAPPAAARPHSPELAAPCLDPPSRTIAAWARLQLLCRQAPTSSATRRATSLASAPRAREPPAARAVACPPAALLPWPAPRAAASTCPDTRARLGLALPDPARGRRLRAPLRRPRAWAERLPWPTLRLPSCCSPPCPAAAARC
jgi:hypothetical protein